MAPFVSILFDRDTPVGEPDVPAYFPDLNLDQVVDAVTAGRQEYHLGPFFSVPLRSVAEITYRQEVLRDLQDAAVAGHVGRFAETMRQMRRRLKYADELRYPLQKQRWFLDAVQVYCDAVRTLAGDLAATGLTSQGLRAFRDHLNAYTGSAALTGLETQAHRLIDDLAAITHTIQIRGPRVRVSRYNGEADYSTQVQDTFAKFRQGAVKDYRVHYPASADMNHVEAQVLTLVAKLYPDVFEALDDFCVRHRDYLDPVVGRFDREVQFYLAWVEYTRRLETGGLSFCYPTVSDQSKEVHATDTFDVALATKLIGEDTVVCNDFHLKGPERIFVVSGPNQGGKTTFARTFGQLHHLAALGLTVPGTDAQLYLVDQLFTHFEKGENTADLRGKLEDDLIRVRGILAEATPASIIILNEIFTSTTLHDAVFLGTNILRQIIDLDALCVCVTFVDELASLGDSTVSLLSTVDPHDPAVRTYKVVRRPADGLAYAITLAERYGLTYQQLSGRIRS